MSRLRQTAIEYHNARAGHPWLYLAVDLAGAVALWAMVFETMMEIHVIAGFVVALGGCVYAGQTLVLFWLSWRAAVEKHRQQTLRTERAELVTRHIQGEVH